MLRLAFDFIITWRETRTRPNAYVRSTIRFAVLRIGSCPIVIFLLILWLFSIFFVILHPVIHLLRREVQQKQVQTHLKIRQI